MDHRYQPYYCEENVWWLGRESQFSQKPRWVSFITNPEQCCLFWHQRAVAEEEFVTWDYHVVLLVKDEGWWIWDLDSRLGLPVAATEYLDQTFTLLLPGIPIWQPQFHLVEMDDFVAQFSTDRSHMLDEAGDWIEPPPTWDPPQAAAGKMNLMEFIDGDSGLGEKMDLAELRQWIEKT